MAAHDGPDTLVYADPPYVQDTRNMQRGNAAYRFDMDDADHVRLAETLRGLAGFVILSGYRCELYDGLYAGWQRRDRATHAAGARDRVESLWLNPAAASRSQLTLKLQEMP